MARGSIRIGTSGWQYDHWKGPFYPERMSSDDMLSAYCDTFDSVEINGSFYRLPQQETVKAWRKAVPNEFMFAAKASRYVTHMKKLKDPGDPLRRLYDSFKGLGQTQGPILFQLPPNWSRNLERLEAFLKSLSGRFRHAFEFRDPSWHEDETFELLRQHGAAHCIHHLEGYLAPRELTAELAYVRLHGPDGPYQGSYDEKTLSGWAQSFQEWASDGHEVVCYFDNDEKGYAPRDAQRLKEMVEDG